MQTRHWARNIGFASFMVLSIMSHSIARAAGAPATAPATTQSASAEKHAVSRDTSASIDKASITEHELRVADGMLKYRATSANLLMRDDTGKLKADIFFTAYEKIGDDSSTARRPVMFVFNGGPGSASVWLHLGTAGPRRLELTPEGVPTPPPHNLVDNPTTWLNATDLVFIDPVGTGYSRPATGEKGEQFFGVKEDIATTAEFIRIWLGAYNRWNSPKFLAGESYGTTRAAGLSRYLLEKQGIALNGIVLISTVLSFQTILPGEGNDLPYVLFLPSFSAVARYHHKLPEDLQKPDEATLIAHAREFAAGGYSAALAKGDTLKGAERQAMVAQVARFTGLDAKVVDQANLRISTAMFQRELLADKRLVVGRFDGRISGYNSDPTDPWTYDPSLSLYLPAYTTQFNAYIRGELKYDSDLSYETLSGRVQGWRFGEPGQGYLNVADDLRSAMAQNPSMRVLVAAGYEDLATPLTASDFTLDHLDLSDALRANIKRTYYEGGHMMYHVPSSRDQLNGDIALFVHAATPTTQPAN